MRPSESSDERQPDDGSARPLELRVHGVGNPPDDTVLPPAGSETHTEVRLVRWGHLIADNRWLPLWVLLAPFTLANVAGWMHPANAPRRAAWCRRIAHVVGISLTVTTTAWVTQLVVDVIAWQGLVGLDVWTYHPLRRLWLAVAVTFLGIVGAFTLAGRTRAAAEAVAPYTAAPESRGGVDDDERIFNPAFFAHEPDLAFLAIVHQLFALGTLVLTAVLAFHRAGAAPTPVPGQPVPLGLGDVFATVGAAQWIGVGLLAVAGLERPGLWGRRWRISGPAVAMGLAILASNAGWSGVMLVARRTLSWLGGAQITLGSEVALVESFTAGVVAAALLAALIAAVALLRGGRGDTTLPAVPRTLLVLRVLIRNVDLIASAGVAVAFAVGGALFVARFQRPADVLAPWPVRIESPGAGWLTRVTAAVPLLLALGAATAALATRSVPRLRPWAASVWEVLTFWPRRFHPLAITPYSEVVVPELQLEVVDGLRQGRRVVVSAHSQGSVLAVSALAGLAGGGVDLAGSSLVTHACPIGPLYGRFFPHQFAPEALIPLAEHLAVGARTGSTWINAWRRGDPVGGPVGSVGSVDGTSVQRGPVEMPLGGVGHTAAFDDPEVRRGIELLLASTPRPIPDEVLPRLDRIRFSPKPMVGWFDPSVLFRAGSSLTLTEAVGPFADRREVLAALDPDAAVIDLAEAVPRADPYTPVWVDLVAYTGDGHVPTMAVAWHLARGLTPSDTDRGPDDEPTVTRAIELAREPIWDEAVALTPRSRPAGPDVALPRGSLLVIGGDLGYPVGTSDTYRDRLAGPYQQACDGVGPSPDGTEPLVVAIPGNHDWYDGLDGFAALMCDRVRLGAWRTAQRRSYAAVALAPGWMLWAVDGGVSGGDVDPTQLDYFTRIGADLSPDVRVILTWPTPAWATGHRHGEAQVALDRFVIDTLGDPRRVALYLSGDSHHYAHLIDEQHGIHYVTAGGGGAFTHPTHTLQRRSDHHSPARATVPAGADGATGFDPAAGPVHLDGVPPGETAFALTDATGRFGPRTLRLGAVFPTFRQSRLALLRHLAFPLINPGFLVVTGAISAVFAMIAVFTVGAGRELLVGLDGLAGHLMTRYWANPLSWIPLLIVLVATTLFARAERADRASVFTARAVGFAHGLAQLAVIDAVLGWASSAGERLGSLVSGRDPASLLGVTISAPSLVGGIVTVVVAAAVGALASAWLLAAYLVVSNLAFGMHDNEVFSALRLTSYKHFLRIRVEPSGDLTVYPVGLAATRRPLRWNAPSGGVGIDAHPATFASDPRLIEAPFTFARPSFPAPTTTTTPAPVPDPTGMGLSDRARPAPQRQADRAAPGAEASPSGLAHPAADAASPLRPPARQVRSAPPPGRPSGPPPSSGPSSTGVDPAPPR